MCVVFAVSFDVTGNDFDFQILWFFWNCFLFFLSPFAQSFFPRTTSPGTSLTDIWIKLVFLSIYIWVVSRNADERSCDWLYTTDSFSFVRFIWRGVASILTVTLCFFLFYSREKIMMMLHNSTYKNTLFSNNKQLKHNSAFFFMSSFWTCVQLARVCRLFMAINKKYSRKKLENFWTRTPYIHVDSSI
jgi:hypothetical protein